MSFECQHGPRECDGNRVQSCVLNQLADDSAAQADFVACQMKFSAEASGAKVSLLTKHKLGELSPRVELMITGCCIFSVRETCRCTRGSHQ